MLHNNVESAMENIEIMFNIFSGIYNENISRC